ncbi:MAG: aromatic ring-hydroxylating dioxygenase subunit alpha [Cyanobacteria bacterium P01_D01_bin.156]
MLNMRSPPDPVLNNAWHVVALAKSLDTKNPLQVNLLGEAIVLWRDGTRIIACQDRCPHRGVSLSMGEVSENHTLVCPYHAMEFDLQGHCTKVPADLKMTTFPQGANLKTYAVQEKYGLVWVALGEPAQDIPTFLDWEQPDTIAFQCGPYAINSSAPRVIENFVDVAHLPFIHKGLLGDPNFPEVSDYSLVVKKDEIIASDIHFYQPNPEGTGKAKSVTYTYKVVRPMVAWFRKGDDSQWLSIFMAVTPVEETRSIVWVGVARNYSPDVSNDQLRAFQDEVMAQDIPMVESQRPQRLPLDLQQEFHFPCDKMSIAYRKWLKKLGLQFGTC